MAAGVEGVGKDTDGTEFEPPDDLAGEMAAESSRAKPGRLGDIPEHGLMSEIEIIPDGGRRRCWPAEKQVRIAGETLGVESISSAARRCAGIAENASGGTGLSGRARRQRPTRRPLAH